MKINRENYEAYFIDYLDGNLDETLVDDFLEFLQLNPDLKQELALVQSVSLEPKKVLFTKKELLIKEKYDFEGKFDKTAISVMEGDSSAEEKTEFESYLSAHPEKQREINLFAKTKLIADKTIVFTKKSKLYHRTPGRKVFLWSARAAAVLLFALTLHWVTDEMQNPLVRENKVAQAENENPAERTIIPIESESPGQSTQGKLAIVQVKPLTAKRAVMNTSNTTTGKIQNLRIENAITSREPVEIPDKMGRLAASLDVPQTNATLATMHIIIPNVPERVVEERLLADIVLEKTGLDKLSLNKITKASLSLVSNITQDKFQYKTNEEGKITTVNLDTRLLAFSIPVKNTED